jgi:hypothetical protein
MVDSISFQCSRVSDKTYQAKLGCSSVPALFSRVSAMCGDF